MNYVELVIQCCWILETSAPNLIIHMFGYHQVEHDIKVPSLGILIEITKDIATTFDLKIAGLIAI